MNRKPLSWKIITKTIPLKQTGLKDEALDREQIKKMPPYANERDQAIIMLLKGSGMRKGALPLLKIKHMIKLDRWHIFEFIVYEGDVEEYHAYCDPEARAYIERYLEYRQRLGEILTGESPLFRKDFNKSDIAEIKNNAKPITERVIDQALDDIVKNAGLRKTVGCKGKANTQRSRVRHKQKLVRKFFETDLLNAGFANWLDMIEGHKLEGLRDNYYHPKDDTVLLGTTTNDGKKRMLGFIEVMNELVISDEDALRKQNEELRMKAASIEELRALVASQQRRIDSIKKQVSSLPDDSDIMQAIKLGVARAATAARYKGRHITREEWKRIKKIHPYAKLDHERIKAKKRRA